MEKFYDLQYIALPNRKTASQPTNNNNNAFLDLYQSREYFPTNSFLFFSFLSFFLSYTSSSLFIFNASLLYYRKGELDISKEKSNKDINNSSNFCIDVRVHFLYTKL